MTENKTERGLPRMIIITNCPFIKNDSKVNIWLASKKKSEVEKPSR